MKKFTYCALIIVLTIVTVFVMFTMRTENYQQAVIINVDNLEDDGKPEGTGYIFDDFDKGINLPVDEETKKGAIEYQPQPSKLSYGFSRFMDLQREMREPPPPFVDFNIPEYTYRNIEVKEESYISEKEAEEELDKMKSRVSIKDRLYLLGLMKDLDLKEIDAVRRAMTEGTTYEEERKIWGMLRTRLSDKEYFKLIEIVNKYEE